MRNTLIESERLIIRAFIPDDLPTIHRIKDQAFGDGRAVDDAAALAERRSWLQWSMLSQEWLPKMRQPPYGDRAVIVRRSGELVGSTGFVPCLNPFDQLPELAESATPSGYSTPEIGLFWVIDPHHQRQGYASEAARAMIRYAFEEMNIKRIIATTEYTNIASQRVMQKVGMTIARNPSPDPPWLQVVGVLANGTRTDDYGNAATAPK